jgi:septal ring factor EnvC (AmiA/AmiB activator)
VAGFDWASVFAFAKDIWWILSVPLTAAAGIGMLYLRSQFPTKAQHDQQTQTLQASIAALSDRVDGTERQAARMESDLRQLPGRQEYQALGDRIGRVEKEVATSVETVRGVEKTVTKIDHTLGLILKHMLEKSP